MLFLLSKKLISWFVFITVDPERDNVEQVGEYVKGDSIHTFGLQF
jgi:cytochrome oxidase Cu insertion factor (SCO1/SenC/PrrC family)